MEPVLSRISTPKGERNAIIVGYIVKQAAEETERNAKRNTIIAAINGALRTNQRGSTAGRILSFVP